MDTPFTGRFIEALLELMLPYRTSSSLSILFSEIVRGENYYGYIRKQEESLLVILPYLKREHVVGPLRGICESGQVNILSMIIHLVTRDDLMSIQGYLPMWHPSEDIKTTARLMYLSIGQKEERFGCCIS